jgi:hypothetical protein
MSEKRALRRSQAIKPYGPGAILDYGQECFVVMDTEAEGTGWRQRGERIYLERLQSSLSVDFFIMPPLAERFGDGAGVMVQRFPSWLFCPKCRKMRHWGYRDEEQLTQMLPSCKNESCFGSTLVPMRYVAVCENGHLEDVNWWRWAHALSNRQAGTCNEHDPNLSFMAESDKGSSLEALVIKCDRCGVRKSLKGISIPEALKRDAGQTCRGKQPWQSFKDVNDACNKPLVAQMRSQTAVHLSETLSALDLKVADNTETDEFEAVIEGLVESQLTCESFQDFEDQDLFLKLTKSCQRKLEFEISEGRVRAWVKHHFDSSNNDTRPRFSGNILEEEWPALTTITTSRHRGSSLIVRGRIWPSNENKADILLSDLIKNIFLIEKLREVRALSGFRRLHQGGQLISPNLDQDREGRARWLPAVEVFGEGIFIQFSNSALKKWEQAQKQKLDDRLSHARSAIEEPDSIANIKFLEFEDVLPRFVMVHTFSHLIINQLCYECGYSGSSIRERLYVFKDRAGILIYTADGDSEGSLGGLVRQGNVDRLGSTMLAALERASWCSNDPICSELPPQGLDGLNRAACHACSLVAETSCDHVNSMLDRELVIGEGGGKVTEGYFSPVLL